MNTLLGLNVTTSSSDAGSGSDDEEDTGGQVYQENDSAELTSSMSLSLNGDNEPIVISDDEDELAAQHKEDSNEEEVHTVKLNPRVRNTALIISNLFVMLLLL